MKTIQFSIILIALCGVLTFCSKDKGNYNYNAINEIGIKNFDTENGYTIRGGDTLKIIPELSGTQDPDGSQEYAYEWSLYFFEKDSVISTERNLDFKVTLFPGKYTLQYKIKDNKTGVTFQTRTELLVTTKVYEGYLVMSEVNGNTRLDMLSYDNASGNYTQITDVLTEMGSALPVQGKPIQVFCFESQEQEVSITPETYRIYLVTETGTHKIHPETFGYGPLDNFRNEMVGDLPTDFNPSFFTGYLQFSFMPVTLMVEGNNVYKRQAYGVVFPTVPINIYAGETTRFKAYPQVIGNDDFVMIYNMDKRTFTTTNSEGANVTDLGEDFGFPEGKDLVHWEDCQSNLLGYAILKDPGQLNYYFLRFYPGFGFTDLYEPINNATDFEQATHYAVHPQFGYVFYSVGGKVYKYDPFLQTSVLMLDKGSSEITHLSFQEFYYSSLNPRYGEMNNLLNVGSFDAAGTEGSNGTLESFFVRDANRPLELQNSWTGFGKITSISYRERR